MNTRVTGITESGCVSVHTGVEVTGDTSLNFADSAEHANSAKILATT